MALRIDLRDGERVVVNGAVLRAKGNLRLEVENRVAILRSSDVMKPEAANTPARRLYYTCMLAYIDEPQRKQHLDNLLPLLKDLVDAFEAPEVKHVCSNFAAFVATQDLYKALTECKKIMAYEDGALVRSDQAAA